MATRRWKATERQVCNLLGMRHVGGPGQPDCRDGAAIAEVKHLRRAVDKWLMREILAKPWARHAQPIIVVSTSGFTRGAREVAGEHANVFLYRKPRR